ncbi:MAG: triose-phosphate isomerase [Flavobacteriales bacterium]
MRRRIIVGNWKMNKNYWQALPLIESLLGYTEPRDLKGVEVVIAPAYPFLHYAYQSTKDTKVSVAAQDISAHESGAYTGEVSADMIRSTGVQMVIIGHSERRRYHGEDAQALSKKIDLALANRMEVIYCIGETLEERRGAAQFKVAKKQLMDALHQLTRDQMQRVCIAYEPVWAIGTGETATAEQAQEMHGYIRQVIADRFGPKTAACIPLLYGGSLKPENAVALCTQPDVDGGLVGGAALEVARFIAVIEALLH